MNGSRCRSKKVSALVLTCWWLPYSDVWENKMSRNLRTKAKFENPHDHFFSWVTCYFLDVQDLVQLACSGAENDYFFFCNTQDLVCNGYINSWKLIKYAPKKNIYRTRETNTTMCRYTNYWIAMLCLKNLRVCMVTFSSLREFHALIVSGNNN